MFGSLFSRVESKMYILLARKYPYLRLQRKGDREMLNNSKKNVKKYPFKWLLWTKKIEIKKLGSAMTSSIFQSVYMPNFRAIGKSVWEKNGNTQKHRQTETQKHTLEFYNVLNNITYMYILKSLSNTYLQLFLKPILLS